MTLVSVMGSLAEVAKFLILRMRVQRDSMLDAGFHGSLSRLAFPIMCSGSIVPYVVFKCVRRSLGVMAPNPCGPRSSLRNSGSINGTAPLDQKLLPPVFIASPTPFGVWHKTRPLLSLHLSLDRRLPAFVFRPNFHAMAHLWQARAQNLSLP